MVHHIIQLSAWLSILTMVVCLSHGLPAPGHKGRLLRIASDSPNFCRVRGSSRRKTWLASRKVRVEAEEGDSSHG